MKEKQCDVRVLAAIRSLFNSMVDIPEAEWRYASRFLHEIHFRKNGYLVRAGKVTDHSFIILNGLVHIQGTVLK